LEKQFLAEAIHFPMGQNGDAAHLPNENIRIINLEKGKNIVGRWLMAVADLD